MIKKKFAIIAAVVILLVAISASAISFATWDNTKNNTSVDINTGESADIKVNDLPFVEKGILVPEDKSFMGINEKTEVTAGSFSLSMVNYTGAKFVIEKIEMYNPKSNNPTDGIIDATRFMQVTILDGSAPVDITEYLKSDRRYDVKVKFSVRSDSNLLTTDMADMHVRIVIKITGVLNN